MILNVVALALSAAGIAAAVVFSRQAEAAAARAERAAERSEAAARRSQQALDSLKELVRDHR